MHLRTCFTAIILLPVLCSNVFAATQEIEPILLFPERLTEESPFPFGTLDIYDSKILTLQLNLGDRVFLSSTPDGLGPYAVDDGLRINGKPVNSNEGFADNPSIVIGQSVLNFLRPAPTLEVTTLISRNAFFGGKFSVDVELLDVGVVRGHTSLYLVVVSNGILWPPNQMLWDVLESPPNTIITVYSDEDDDEQSPDAVVFDGTLSLRAERNGNGDGRVYLITISDADGNFECCTVVVPNSRSQADIDDVFDQASAATAFCDFAGELPPGFVIVGE